MNDGHVPTKAILLFTELLADQTLDVFLTLTSYLLSPMQSDTLKKYTHMYVYS